MEKRAAVKNRRRGLGLNALFWRYLITSGSLAAALCVLWLILFNILVNKGFVMSAYTAVRRPDRKQNVCCRSRRYSIRKPFPISTNGHWWRTVRLLTAI